MPQSQTRTDSGARSPTLSPTPLTRSRHVGRTPRQRLGRPRHCRIHARERRPPVWWGRPAPSPPCHLLEGGSQHTALGYGASGSTEPLFMCWRNALPIGTGYGWMGDLMRSTLPGVIGPCIGIGPGTSSALPTPGAERCVCSRLSGTLTIFSFTSAAHGRGNAARRRGETNERAMGHTPSHNALRSVARRAVGRGGPR